MSVSDDDSGPIYRAQMARLPKECSHRRVFARIWSEGGDGQWITLLGHDQRCSNAHARVCADCREWLSLGPSNDAGELAVSVAIEIRAAEIAVGLLEDETARWYMTRGAVATDEGHGWFFFDRDITANDGFAGHLLSPAGLAGYLARYIVDHAELADAG